MTYAITTNGYVACLPSSKPKKTMSEACLTSVATSNNGKTSSMLH